MENIPNLRWFCDSCTVLPIDTRNYMAAELSSRLIDIKSFADNLLTNLIPSVLTTQNDIVNMTPLSSTGQDGINSGALNGSFTTADSESVDMEIQTITPESPLLNMAGVSNVNTDRRKRGLSPGMGPKSKQQKVIDEQNQSVPASEQQQQQPKRSSLADMVAKPKARTAPEQNITVKTNMMRSLYLTPFVPATEPSDIMSHLGLNDELKHIVPNIKCTKLTKKRSTALTFVSFKLDVPRHHYDIIVNPEIWQMDGKDDITIKEFINKREPNGQNPFSKPANNKNQGANHLPSNSQSGKSDEHQRKTGPKQKPANQQQNRGQNFQNKCQKLCCIHPKEIFNFFQDRCDVGLNGQHYRSRKTKNQRSH